MSIEGKVALVTGAAKGIGRGIALRLAADGANIAIVDLDEAAMNAVADEVRALGRKATVFRADVANRDEVYAAVEHAEKELGGFDIMINNAGICRVQPLIEATPEEVERILKVNFEGVLWGIQAAARKFKERRQKGKIINASSIAGHESFPLLGVYSATKFAIRALTQAAAKEFGRDGIIVNAYCPGAIATDMLTAVDLQTAHATGSKVGATNEQFAKDAVLGRLGKPEDIAAFVSYLAGPDSDYMTGQSPIVDGGVIYR